MLAFGLILEHSKSEMKNLALSLEVNGFLIPFLRKLELWLGMVCFGVHERHLTLHVNQILPLSVSLVSQKDREMETGCGVGLTQASVIDWYRASVRLPLFCATKRMIDTRGAVVLLCCLLVSSHEDDLLFNTTVSVGTGSEVNHVTGSLIWKLISY